MQSATPLTPVIVGNPFAPTGRGFTALSHFRALREVGVEVAVCDIASRAQVGRESTEIEAELGQAVVTRPGSWINIYHVNLDEVPRTLERFRDSFPDGAFNVLYPSWELANYPPEWLAALAPFNELWVPSKFMQTTLSQQTPKPVIHMPHAVEARLSSFLGRAHFGLPDQPFLFLFSFDFRSFVVRKNPQALFDLFEGVLAARPYADFRLVIKMHGAEVSAQTARDSQRFRERLGHSPIRDRVILLEGVFADNEMKNLMHVCDCFISLHHSEGFGLGLAEAMYLGKPVIGTAYSGNMDFMTADNSCLVDFKLVPVREGQYPHWQGQVWAEPDLEQAAVLAGQLLDNPGFGRALGQRASQHIRTHFSNLAIGLRLQARLQAIGETLPQAVGIEVH